MIVVHASIPIDPDSRTDALEAAGTLAEHSRAEAGVIDYRATIDLADENLVRMVEEYEDEAAFSSHLESDHFQSFGDRLPEFAAGDPEITRFDVENASDVEL